MSVIRENLILQKLYSFLHIRLFNRRSKNQFKFNDKYILSVGNLSAGGTGKTPAAILLAKEAIRRGFRTGIVLRGYKGSKSKEGILVSDGQNVFCDHRQSGDEAQLFTSIKGLKIAIGKNRKDVILKYLNDCDLVILDDAFQNPSIYRNHDLVLIDTSVAFENAGLIPWGKFREGLSALLRANSVLLTKTDLCEKRNLEKWESSILDVNKKIPLFRSVHKVSKKNIPDLSQKKIGMICGIGNPESFRKTVINIYPKIHTEVIYPDHHTPKKREFLDLFEKDAQVHWLTTQKDFIRLQPMISDTPYIQRLYIIDIELELINDKQLFFDTVFP